MWIVWWKMFEFCFHVFVHSSVHLNFEELRKIQIKFIFKYPGFWILGKSEHSLRHSWHSRGDTLQKEIAKSLQNKSSNPFIHSTFHLSCPKGTFHAQRLLIHNSDTFEILKNPNLWFFIRSSTDKNVTIQIILICWQYSSSYSNLNYLTHSDHVEISYLKL